LPPSSYFKRGSTEGELELRIRGNGATKKTWEDIKKNREPDGSHIGLPWLPETHGNSNFILLRIPIEISNNAHGEKAIAVEEGPLHCSFPLSPAAITRLQDLRLVRLPRPVRAKRQPIDYTALQQTYHRMLTEGPFSTQTELARHLGVSRVWVSRVLKGIRRKAG
jgi:hypothetical protein